MACKDHQKAGRQDVRHLPLRGRVVPQPSRHGCHLRRQPVDSRNRRRNRRRPRRRRVQLPPQAAPEAHNSPAPRQPPRRNPQQPARHAQGRRRVCSVPGRRCRRPRHRARVLRPVRQLPRRHRRHHEPARRLPRRPRHQRHRHPRGRLGRGAPGSLLPRQRVGAELQNHATAALGRLRHPAQPHPRPRGHRRKAAAPVHPRGSGRSPVAADCADLEKAAENA